MIDLEMVRVPAGAFIRGADLREASESEETPMVRRWLEEYEIGKYPVTVSQWLTFIDSAHYEWPKDAWAEWCKDKRAMPEVVLNAPITYVNWHDCKYFADWLTVETGRKFSLPTEDQWEKACRGTNGQKFPWGNAQPKWVEEFAKESDPEGNFLLSPVGSAKEKASPFGCEQMWSGVQEWCDDWFLLNFANPEDADNDPRGQYKAVRGGNTIAPGWPRCTARQRVEPTYRSYILGFRLVCAVAQKTAK